MENNNPLLDFSGLPRFNEIKPEHIDPAVDYMLNRNRNQIAKLTASNATPTWQNFMRPLEDLSDHLARLWAPVSHLNKVRDTNELRHAYEICLPKITDYATELVSVAGLLGYDVLEYQFGMLKLAFDNVKPVGNEMGLFDFDVEHVIKHPDKLSGRKIRILVGWIGG